MCRWTAVGYWSRTLLALAACGRDSTGLGSGHGKIAFASSRSGSSQIWVMNTDGTAATQVTHDTVPNMDPAWSRDAAELAFVALFSDRASIYTANADGTVMHADGSAQVRLTNNHVGDNQPGWSPDGSQIAFASDRDGDAEIYVMNADGTRALRLTNSPGLDFGPSWRRSVP